MKVKVCGITTKEQLLALNQLDVDMVGFNFYPASKRYIAPDTSLDLNLDLNFTRVGVFVNSDLNNILEKKALFDLDYAQLHGDEDIHFCKALANDIKIIKVWRVRDELEEELIQPFDELIDYHLFDTYTKAYGGSGERFDWDLLSELKLKKPIILSGGISSAHAEELKGLTNNNIWGVDINSGFEVSPGVKDIDMIKSFINQLNS